MKGSDGTFLLYLQPHMYFCLVEQNVRNHFGWGILLEERLSELELLGEHGCVHVFIYMFMIDLASYWPDLYIIHSHIHPNVLSVFTSLWCTGKELCSLCSVFMAVILQVGFKFSDIQCTDHFCIHSCLWLHMESYFLYSPISDPFPLFFHGLLYHWSPIQVDLLYPLSSKPCPLLISFLLSSCTGNFTNIPST